MHVYNTDRYLHIIFTKPVQKGTQLNADVSRKYEINVEEF